MSRCGISKCVQSFVCLREPRYNRLSDCLPSRGGLYHERGAGNVDFDSIGEYAVWVLAAAASTQLLDRHRCRHFDDNVLPKVGWLVASSRVFFFYLVLRQPNWRVLETRSVDRLRECYETLLVFEKSLVLVYARFLSLHAFALVEVSNTVNDPFGYPSSVSFRNHNLNLQRADTLDKVSS